MSKNTPAPTTTPSSVSVSSLEQVGRKKSKRKTSRVRLPTPPPDPAALENDHDGKKSAIAEKTDEFLEYLENLQKAVPPHQHLLRTNSLFAPVIATEDAFDHLEKLYKLMEQMLLLREQNAKLHRRVRDLEHFRKIQNIEKYVENVSNADVSEVDTALAENLLDTILMDSKRDTKAKPQYQFRFRQSILRKQSDKSPIDMERLQDSYRRTSALSGNDKKVSKWTKVKAAFRWEKASQTVSDVKSQDSGIGGMQPINYEVARYLRVPSTSEEPGISPSDSGACEISTPGTISSTSSTEDVFCQGPGRGLQEDSSDDDQSFTLEYIPIMKDDSLNIQKSPSGKGPRTTWAKMKDIIQTRNSIKKRNRLSGKSDDFRPEDLMMGSDEDVFESKESKSPLSFAKSCVGEKFTSLEESLQISSELMARYQQAAAEENACVEQEAILKSDSANKLQDEIQKNYRDLQTKLSLEFQEKMKEWEKMKQSSSNSATSSSTATGSALSPEELKEQAFKKKMEEWERIKGQSKHNMQLQSEEHLPLEFRKKLQEWQKIKKGTTKDDSSSNNSSQKKKLGEWPKWKSMSSGHRADLSPVEQQPLSEDFIKKLETWKQIKSNNCTANEDEVKGNKTPSPKLCRKDGGSSRQSKKIKEQTEKELQWFEKELSKIEREKQRLERERQKFLEREERLTKLRRSVMGDNKQNILVQTPSGFYRFEGISRKFTQKLYEWEKAQGIGPEASTFALLSKCFVPTIATAKHETQPRLIKSKSADSIMNSDLNLTHPLLSQQPSSLSLNDMDNLENQCILNDTMVSEPDMLVADNAIDVDEPEAVIVEVEDIVEETAAPLQFFLEKKRIPVYQHQELTCTCEGETEAAPKVQRSESTRAQNNYNLIEEIIDQLKLLSENENDISHRELTIHRNNENEPTYVTESLKNLYALQTDSSSRLIEKLVRLQEANTKVTANIAKEEVGYTTNRVVEMLDSVQDLSVDLLHLAEKLHTELMNRNTNEVWAFRSHEKYPGVTYALQQQNSKILELRRVLSYLCAASDATAPGKKKKILRNARLFSRRSSSKEKDKAKCNSSKENASPRNTPVRQKSKEKNPESDDELNVQIAQGAIKKRYRYRQKGSSTRAVDDSDDEDTRLQKKAKKKSQQMPSTENQLVEVETSETDQNVEGNVGLDPDVIQKVAVPTKLNYVNASEPIPKMMDGSSVQIFVKTTRKLFTPLVMSSFATESRKLEITASPTIVSVPSFHRNVSVKVSQQKTETHGSVSHLPPLPASPTAQRKNNKEISPNIRLMLARYNQKIQEQESSGCKSGGSSGSSSPVAWRSPINERRVRTQTERYQQELMKLSPHQVHKSASLGFMNGNGNKLSLAESLESPKINTKGILKSSSACALTARVRSEQSVTISDKGKSKFIPNELSLRLCSESDSRSYRLQKAKENFLNAPLSPASAPPVLAGENNDGNEVKYPERNRLSQISVGSESSYDSSAYEGVLIKSASAGMINIDPETYRQIHPEVHGGGYVSLPRASKKRKEGLMSNIASKFRKVKMRRNKDPNKMNTISTLCRQSLVVDISTGSDETLTAEQAEASRKDSLTVPSDSKGSSSADTTPPSSRSGSWIRKPRLFKPKQ